MKKKISKLEFDRAESNLNKILEEVTQVGRFKNLSAVARRNLARYTAIVESYENENYTMAMPQSIEGIIALKMFEKKLKQKEMANLLEITDTKLSEILHRKRKPGVSFLKAMNEKLGIDGNLLLRAS